MKTKKKSQNRSAANGNHFKPTAKKEPTAKVIYNRSKPQ